MPNWIQVTYHLPVACVVDLDTDEIVKVIVDDETIEREYGVFFDAKGDLRDADDETAQAEALAERLAWPAWHFGY